MGTIVDSDYYDTSEMSEVTNARNGNNAFYP